MTFKNAIDSLQDGGAAKRPSMGGYWWKDQTGISDEDKAAGKYMLKCVERNGTTSTFYMNGATGADSNLEIDGTFIAGIMAEDWEISTKEAYEAARSGSGRW